MIKRSRQDNGVGRNKLGRFTPTHNLSKRPLHKTWRCMIMRCSDPSFIGYKYYGGAGIIVCDEWFYDFKKFYDWSLSNGWKPGLDIDRYPNKRGNYEPTNCRWATRKQNSRNRTNNSIITVGNESLPIIEWSERVDISADVISHRLRDGWGVEDAVFTPNKIPRISKEKIESAKQLVASGKSKTKTASILGISLSSVKKCTPPKYKSNRLHHSITQKHQ